MSATDILTLTIAILGAITGVTGTVLSVLSYLRELDREKVKLRVGVYNAMTTWDLDNEFLSVSVTNLSSFAVTIREAGLLTENGKARVISMEATTSERKPLPVRLEPRTGVSVWFPPNFLLSPDCRNATAAYVSTDCGEQFTAGEGVIPEMIARKRSENERS